MDIQSFKRILTTFADQPADVNLAKGQLILQLRDELLEASITITEGRVSVQEGGRSFTAEKWIIERVARLSVLADRILNYITPEPCFVVPAGALLDQLNTVPNE